MTITKSPFPTLKLNLSKEEIEKISAKHQLKIKEAVKKPEEKQKESPKEKPKAQNSKSAAKIKKKLLEPKQVEKILAYLHQQYPNAFSEKPKRSL